MKEKEDLILNAEAEGLELEYDLFSAVRDAMKIHIRQIQQLASVLSELDVLLSFATVSEKQNYVKPTFHDSKGLEIKNGRHPVVEKMMDHSLYVPNSCILTGRCKYAAHNWTEYVREEYIYASSGTHCRDGANWLLCSL